MSGRVEVPGNLECFNIQLAPVDTFFRGNKIEKASHTAGQIRYGISCRQLQTGHDILAQLGWSEKLSVFRFLFCLAVSVIVIEVFSVQTVQTAIAGVGIVDILLGDAVYLCIAAVDQVEYLFVYLTALFFRNLFTVKRIFHIGHLRHGLVRR